MEEFDTIQMAAVCSCQCLISLNQGSISRLADSCIKHTIAQGYPFLCCQPLQELQPIPEKHGECWVRALLVCIKTGEENEESEWCTCYHTLC